MLDICLLLFSREFWIFFCKKQVEIRCSQNTNYIPWLIERLLHILALISQAKQAFITAATASVWVQADPTTTTGFCCTKETHLKNVCAGIFMCALLDVWGVYDT